jgi:hypothetical protein
MIRRPPVPQHRLGGRGGGPVYIPSRIWNDDKNGGDGRAHIYTQGGEGGVAGVARSWRDRAHRVASGTGVHAAPLAARLPPLPARRRPARHSGECPRDSSAPQFHRPSAPGPGMLGTLPASDPTSSATSPPPPRCSLRPAYAPARACEPPTGTHPPPCGSAASLGV